MCQQRPLPVYVYGSGLLAQGGGKDVQLPKNPGSKPIT